MIMKSNNIVFRIKLLVISALAVVLLGSCYSFTGGSTPEHLKTLYIANVIDNSGFGNPEYKMILSQTVHENFKRDNSLALVESGGDAKLSIAISSINESTGAIGSGELETERRVTVNCSVEYFDNVKKKQILNRSFSQFAQFSIKDAQTARNEAIKTILKQIADDVLLAVVSGW